MVLLNPHHFLQKEIGWLVHTVQEDSSLSSNQYVVAQDSALQLSRQNDNF